MRGKGKGTSCEHITFSYSPLNQTPFTCLRNLWNYTKEESSIEEFSVFGWKTHRCIVVITVDVNTHSLNIHSPTQYFMKKMLQWDLLIVSYLQSIRAVLGPPPTNTKAKLISVCS